MIKSIKYISLGLMGLLLSGCVETRQPTVKQFNTGMKKSQEWKDYNKYANENKQPVLDYAATTLKYQFKSGKVALNYDTFLSTEPKVVIQTKWHNVKSSDIYEFKFYMPDGRLYHYEKFSPKKDYAKYTVGRKMYISDVMTDAINGKWKVEVIANEKHVIYKDFIIGNNNQPTQVKTNTTIGVFPYLDDREMSSWKHGGIIAKYISWKTLINNSNVKVIPSQLIKKDLPNVEITYKTFEDFIDNDLQDEDSIILSLAKKYNMDYILLGKVLSAWGSSTQDTTVNTYIISVKDKKIIDEEKTTASLYRSDFNIATSQNSQGIHPQRITVYKEIYSKLIDNINKISNK